MLKKHFFNIPAIMLFFVLIIAGCGTNQITKNATIENQQQSPTQIVDGETIIDLENLDNLIQVSTDIIIGNIVKEENFNDSTSLYTVQVKNAIKGSLELSEKIDVYKSQKGLSQNKDMIFFLEYFESEYYPRPIYNTLGEDSILEIDGDTVHGNKHIYKEFDKFTDLLKHIQKSPKIKEVKTNVYVVKDKAKDAKELIDTSEFIVKLVPEEIVLDGKQVSSYKVRSIKVYQGEFNSQTLNLPSDVVIGKEYIVFLKQRDGALTLSTRQDSLLTTDNKQWEEIQQTLEN